MPKPLAAASIAQVHVASLKNGREVVVKILRPGMREIIDLDLEVLDTLARLADEYWVDARRLRPIELVREYRKTILDELDLLREAGNAAQLKRNFSGSRLLYVPEVHWDSRPSPALRPARYQSSIGPTRTPDGRKARSGRQHRLAGDDPAEGADHSRIVLRAGVQPEPVYHRGGPARVGGIADQVVEGVDGPDNAAA